MLAHALLAFSFLQLPQNDTIPQVVGSHTTLNRKVYCNLPFYWLHSGFYDNSKDQLQSEMRIAKTFFLTLSTELKWKLATVKSFKADVSSIRCKTLYGGQFTLSTHLTTLNYPVVLSHSLSNICITNSARSLVTFNKTYTIKLRS